MALNYYDEYDQEYNDEFRHQYDDEYPEQYDDQYLEESITDEDVWYAMTDGMYGDYPGPGWDPERYGF